MHAADRHRGHHLYHRLSGAQAGPDAGRRRPMSLPRPSGATIDSRCRTGGAERHAPICATCSPACWSPGRFPSWSALTGGMMALNDRLKLRSHGRGRKGRHVCICASEECAIRAVEPAAGRIWAPRGGEPVIVDCMDGGAAIMAMRFFVSANMRWCATTDRCIACRVCERQCANEVHFYDPETKRMTSRRVQVRQLPPLRVALPDARAEDRQNRPYL